MSKADLPFVAPIERTRGYETLVDRWDGALHLSAIDDDHCERLLWRHLSRRVDHCLC
ncbi:protein of unknown function [Bradyrhizobium vignae]|uniref:Uncharacterized protein n=1 Tax=Bradyrhizobium vignae TaxID=1549949 RepID=A0A2U3Q2Q3_9BRAD|nr:protein of unknown function [Bradyrhizobium vignae]